jgi:hypothetical protein
VAFAAKIASTYALPRGACRVLGQKLPGFAWNLLCGSHVSELLLVSDRD